MPIDTENDAGAALDRVPQDQTVADPAAPDASGAEPSDADPRSRRRADPSHSPLRRLEAVQAHCREHGLRLTDARRRTLELLLEEQRPLSAYALLERLAADGFPPHPPTVYRALDFLKANGFVHKLNAGGAFVACARPGQAHSPQFLICTECQEAREICDPALEQALIDAAQSERYTAIGRALEIVGVCGSCARRAADEPPGVQT